MRTWNLHAAARGAGARTVGERRDPAAGGPDSVTIDSRLAGPGALFVGLPGQRVDGGAFAAAALERGVWGVLATPEHAEPLARAGGDGVVLAAEDPLKVLQGLATAWRRELGAQVIGVTGSTGKTSTKDLLLAILSPHVRTVATRANFNTEIGMPLEILNAPRGTEVLVLEMGMRGAGQIAELAQIAEPDVAVIVSIGPVHLELMGSIEAIAAAKAELIAGLAPGGTAVIPARERLLEPHLRDDVTIVTCGTGGQVRFLDDGQPGGDRVIIDAQGERIELEVPFTQAHLRANLLPAVAAARAVGVTPSGGVRLALSPGRGQRYITPSEVTVIDDCYNANPISMRAALDDLKATAAASHGSRRIAVLGDMLELGRTERDYHVQLGEQAAAAGVDVLVTVGPLAASIAERFAGETHSVADATEAAAIVPELLAPGDIVLVKGSRGVGLELVCRALGARDDGA
ncbi:MAG TPA: UDP-N-acetylmuramoyl-tripeptide--D-alanyl-D-alanine ligase [Solirubrobacteraceae bacterium]|nr:UDP-N-acetylmuramoyl-tripeptide--D-alanyl-D-alanine ligase [Solirubrobacteraceae bacterium]